MNASTYGFGWVAGALWCAPALASAGGRLVYSAPQSCAAQADFEARVAERGGHFDAYVAPDRGRELRVAIVQSPTGYVGTFQASQSEGASAIREVHGATCQDVVAALAVVSAIALRGEDDAANEQGTTDATAGASSPVSEPAPTAAPQLASAVAAVPPRPAAPVVDSGRLRASSAGAAARQVAVSAGTVRFDTARSITLSAGGELGILPSKVLPRYDLSISAASFVAMPDGKSYMAGVIPRFRLSYFGNGTSDNDSQKERVSARGVGFGLGLCWSPTYDMRDFVALFCAEYGSYAALSAFVSRAERRVRLPIVRAILTDSRGSHYPWRPQVHGPGQSRFGTRADCGGIVIPTGFPFVE